MKEEKTEGIVLRVQEYKENSRILSLFTPQGGVLQMIIKRLSQKNSRLLTLSTPFTWGEFHYVEGNSTLLRFSEGSVFSENLELRERFSSLQAAGAMNQLLLQFFLPGSPDPLLYALYKSYLTQIPNFQEPKLLLASFYIKFLTREGLLDKALFPTTDHPLFEALKDAKSFEFLKTLTLSPFIINWLDQFCKKLNIHY